MELDHVFMMIAQDGPEIARLEALGLVETYRRRHVGQGTANACYAVENFYLELLWVDDPEAARSPAIRRTGLFERSLWRRNGACPFGIAWRGDAPPDIETWPFRPPYLPDGVSIPVAVASDDPRQPMLFRSPATSPPIDWPAERRGALQSAAGLSTLASSRLTLPASVAPSSALDRLSAATALSLAAGSDYALELTLRTGDGATRRLFLPELELS